MINPFTQTNVKLRSKFSEKKGDPLGLSLTSYLGGMNAK